ncbi:universal stress protein [Lentiprolixibacter aurantiacus]|uniref:Universal stress protein n=1 Tax=Lentiprolixibacter aurantiacus TaxID=2993939 RepID=A0AAE3MPW0_9FLAO|nr:universal stress protein [Lentiprolixibacter aurantiacus]MCX2720772.1 universal stress protein [Lentiprolixibacter aurantiacus]
MKSLLYATDYSPNSVPALKFAWNLSQKLDVPLYVMHVFDINATFISTVSIAYARMEETAFLRNTERLKEFCLEHLAKIPDQKKLITVVAENSIASLSILEKAEEIGAGMILAGKRGSTLMRDLFMGSTASGLIEKSHIPVMLLPEHYEFSSIETIVYATAFEQADIYAIRDITHWASLFGAEIRIFHVSTRDEYAGEDQMEWFKEMLSQKVNYPRMQFELRFAEDIYKALTDYLWEVNADLLAMLEREEHHLISNIWHRDLVKRMKGESNLPLLSIPKSKEHASGLA